jgi:F0F1-type ATP synthase membrane subunit b/b'
MLHREETVALKFEDLVKPETLITSFILTAAWRFAFPVLGTALRPAAKTVIKGGLAVADWASAVAAETRERVEDLAAEVRDEANARREGAQSAPQQKRAESKAPQAHES